MLISMLDVIHLQTHPLNLDMNAATLSVDYKNNMLASPPGECEATKFVGDVLPPLTPSVPAVQSPAPTPPSQEPSLESLECACKTHWQMATSSRTTLPYISPTGWDIGSSILDII